MSLIPFFVVLRFVVGVSIPHVALAENDSLKSETTALILAFDPIPADALFYGEKPIQGTINLIVGGVSGALFWTGAIHALVHTNSGCSNSDLSSCDWSGLAQAALMIGGGLLYFPSLIWDGISGMNGVKDHNKRIMEKKSHISIRPTIVPDSEMVVFGINGRF